MKNIMKYKIRIASLLWAATTLFSCNVLELEPLDSFTEDNIFSDASLTEAYVNGRYSGLRNGWSNEALRYVSDESMCNHNWGQCYTLNDGKMTADDAGDYHVWSSYYARIKECNIFFENLEKLEQTSASQEDINRMIGEVKFLRAYYYVELVNRYGGVPYITTTFELEGDHDMARNSYEECVTAIVAELDEAADLLPLSYSGSDYGRATKGAALALKSKILLYAASPLWNPDGTTSKWQAAADAAKAVIDLTNDGGSPMYALEEDYGKLFLMDKSSEAIFLRLYTTEQGHSFDWQNSPNGFAGYGATCVSQNLVDAYELIDGSTIDPSTQYQLADPYQGRDPRFYQTVVYNGSEFRGRQIETFLYTQAGKPNGTGGVDSEVSPIEAWNSSESRYTLRKFMDESLGAQAWSINASHPWIYSRLGEIYLNYAEASAALGNEEQARTYLNKIRERARGDQQGILPDVTASGSELVAKIRHERRIELAFEEHRFFDVRRWMIAEQTENESIDKIMVYKSVEDGTLSHEIAHLQNRTFISPQHYLLPVPNSERRKAPSLTQNPGYGGI